MSALNFYGLRFFFFFDFFAFKNNTPVLQIWLAVPYDKRRRSGGGIALQ
jgi:hypothetical protein